MTSTVTIDWTLIIAIYAAVVATFTLVWDWWKWKNAGPKLHVRASTGMAMAGRGSIGTDLFMMMNVTNRGDRATTITHFTLHHYVSWWQFVRNRAMYNAIVNTWGEGSGNQTPHTLEPGKVWMGLAKQTPDLLEMAKTGRLYLAIVHSHSTKPISVRVRPA